MITPGHSKEHSGERQPCKDTFAELRPLVPHLDPTLRAPCPDNLRVRQSVQHVQVCHKHRLVEGGGPKVLLQRPALRSLRNWDPS